MQKLPISKQTFKELREEDCLYVDKTAYAYEIMKSSGAYFLARPRRFGKSLFLSTLMELAQGNKTLFKATWIENKWDWSKKFPVIHLAFASMPFQGLGLAEAIKIRLTTIYETNKIEPKTSDLKELFYNLIIELYKKNGKVVLLIDEYDKPILDAIEKDLTTEVLERQDVMKNFYAVLKDCEPYLHCTFITGITKFAKVSIFSDLNHLEDISFDRRFTATYGYTQQELEYNFAPFIDTFLAENEHYTKERLSNKIKEWYNGYSWDGHTRVYNPYAILHFFQKKTFTNTWFESGTPTFLVRKVLHQQTFEVEDIQVNLSDLDFHSIETIENIPLMFQAGYLTIKSLDEHQNAMLNYPNREVSESFYRFLLKDLNTSRSKIPAPIHLLATSFRKNEIEKIEHTIKQVFTELPYDVYTNQAQARQVEGFYHGIIHVLFHYLGLYVQSEVHTTHGRADAVVTTDTHIFIFEFKINQSSAIALAQIKNKDYALKYQTSGKQIIQIGANFNTETKYMDSWEISILT
jgi:hypothetical protein